MDETAPRRSDGFRERGAQTTRLEAFVDAAFAFAVTLLVISVNSVPESVAALLEAIKGIPAFAASFLLITRFWYAHNRWSRRYGLDDGVSVALSLLLVFLVLVYVYPLKMLFGAFFNFLSGGYVPAGFRVRSADDVLTMFAIYAIAWSTMGIVIMLLYWRAFRLRATLALDTEESALTFGEICSWAMAPITGVLSMLATLFVPDDPQPWQVSLPGMVYFLMAATPFVDTIATRRARAFLGAAARVP